MFVKGTYQGKPTLTFKSDEADRFPFSFGPAKAVKLVKAMADEGTQNVLDALFELAGTGVTQDEVEKVKASLK